MNSRTFQATLNALSKLVVLVVVVWVPVRLCKLHSLESNHARSKLDHARDVLEMCSGNERPEFGLLDCAAARMTVRSGSSVFGNFEAAISRLFLEAWDAVVWAGSDLILAIGWKGCIAMGALPVVVMLGRRAARTLSNVLVPIDTYLEDETEAFTHHHPRLMHVYRQPPIFMHKPMSGSLAWKDTNEWNHVKNE